jgi:hypothetical protein
VRRDLGRAGDGHEVDVDALLAEEAAGEAGEGGGDAGAGRQVGGCADRRVVACREGEPAAAELEVEQHVERAAGFLDQVAAGDADVCGAVRDELGDVLRADEQREELAAERREQRALAARLELEARARAARARRRSAAPCWAARCGSWLRSPPTDAKNRGPSVDGPRWRFPDRVWLDLRSKAMHAPPPRPVGAVVMGVMPMQGEAECVHGDGKVAAGRRGVKVLACMGLR